MCAKCDHFVDDNILVKGDFYFDDPAKPAGEEGLARFIHLEDGEQEFDHDAVPGGELATLSKWKLGRPELFIEHPDGKIGPNSIHHPRRGKEY